MLFPSTFGNDHANHCGDTFHISIISRNSKRPPTGAKALDLLIFIMVMDRAPDNFKRTFACKG